MTPTLGEPSVTVIPLSNYQFKFSTAFYQLALEITNVAGEDSFTLSTNIDNIINTATFIALSEIEQNILLAAAETYLDSFNYWTTQTQWNILTALYNGDKIQTKGGGRNLARKDANGAIAGGIGGAIAGAIGGTFAGGVGAGPGALLGFVTGALSVGIANSVLAVLEPNGMIAESPQEDYTPIDNLLIPTIWTKVALNNSQPIPLTLEFQSGLINSSH